MNTVLILASRSPRRAELLRAAGCVFKQAPSPYPEPPLPPVAPDPEALAMRLAENKAQGLIPPGSSPPGAWVLAADTLIVGPAGQLMGQPDDRRHAWAMLQSLVGRSHRVITGVCLLAPNGQREAAFADTAEVALGAMEPASLMGYLDSGAWRGKAGGYNLLELQATWPFDVRGDPATVAGLPMRRLEPHLRRFVGSAGSATAED